MSRMQLREYSRQVASEVVQQQNQKSQNCKIFKMTEQLEEQGAVVVANQYGLVRHICQFLPGSSLRSCAKVNELWEKAVDAENKKRQISMFHWTGEAQNPKVSFFYLKK